MVAVAPDFLKPPLPNITQLFNVGILNLSVLPILSSAQQFNLDMNALETTKKEAVLFLTHVWSEDLARRFIAIRQATMSTMQCFVLIDAADSGVVNAWRNYLDKISDESQVFLFDVNQLETSLGYDCNIKGKLVPGSTHYPVLSFWKSFHYERYWVIEFDVLLTDDWSAFFKLFEHDESDLLLSHLASYEAQPQWAWWASLRVPFEILSTIPKDDYQFLQKGFFPIYRISNQALSAIHSGYIEGWQGHYEAVIPTLLNNKKLSIKDFNDFGELYSQRPIGPKDGHPPFSSLRWRPEVEPHELHASVGLKIFHPVKS